MNAAARRDWFSPQQRALLERLRAAALAGSGIVLGGFDGELVTARSLARQGIVRIEVGRDETGRKEHRVALVEAPRPAAGCSTCGGDPVRYVQRGSGWEARRCVPMHPDVEPCRDCGCRSTS